MSILVDKAVYFSYGPKNTNLLILSFVFFFFFFFFFLTISKMFSQVFETDKSFFHLLFNQWNLVSTYGNVLSVDA